MSVLAVYNLKGGVGKTAATVNLSYLSAETGHHTLVWDLDPQGAATFYFRVKPRLQGSTKHLVRGKLDLDGRIKGTDFEHLDLLPADPSNRNLAVALDRTRNADKRLARLLTPFRHEYDHIFLDCPPTLTQTAESIFAAADVLLVPVIPTTLSMRTLDQIRSFLEEQNIDHLQVLPFFSMIDRRKLLHRNIRNEFADGRDGFLEAGIPFASVVERMGAHRAPLFTYDRSSRATHAYRALWDEITSRIRQGSNR